MPRASRCWPGCSPGSSTGRRTRPRDENRTLATGLPIAAPLSVERAELFLVPLSLREPFRTAHGERRERAILLLALHGGGMTGWGECVAGERPDYSPETTDTAWSTLATFLLPGVVGATHMGGAAGVGATMAWVRGHPMARAAVEMAAWDLQAKLADVPLWKAIGGSRRPVPTGIALGLQADRARLNEQIAAALAEGYRRIKLKVEPGKDVERVATVRERFPDAPLSVDANGAFGGGDAASARAQLRVLDRLGLLMIEQPLPADDLLGHARLQAELATPICLDESVGSLAQARQALELGAARVINVKPGRVGGTLEARRIHELCGARGVPVWCGGMLESGVGRAHNVALATLPGFTLPGDLSPSRRYWARDLVEPEWEMSDGMVTPPAGPGIGVAVDRERIEATAARRLAVG